MPLRRGAAILSVGDELLAGRVTDSNATWASATLRDAGFPVVWRATVGDDPGEIAAAIAVARDWASVILIGGGLGPTLDDVTRAGVAEGFGVPLARDPAAFAWLSHLYTSRGRELSAASATQADLPAGATMVENHHGTAPGFLIENGATLAMVVPGVPGEFRAMVTASLLPRLRSRADRRPVPQKREITVAGMAESDVGAAIADLMARGRDPSIGSYPRSGRVVLVLESFREDPAAAEAALMSDVAVITERLGDAVVGPGDLDLNVVVAQMLMARRLTIGVAESLTGGLISDGLVQVPGVSAVFRGGVAAYSNDVKCDILRVPPALIAEHGAVSGACARAMAEGVRRVLGADLGIATTGVAGPTGGSTEKPVGTTWIAVADAAGTIAARHAFIGDRAAIREAARERAFDLVRRRLLGVLRES